MEGNRDLAIFVETKETNYIFGGYISIPFPIPNSDKKEYTKYKDLNSCIFEVTTLQICRALQKKSSNHLDTYPNFYFRFGCLGGGINLQKELNIRYGKKSRAYQGDSTFGFPETKENTKRIVVYQLGKI